MRLVTPIISVLLLVGLAAGSFFVYKRYTSTETSSKFRTAKVERGDLLSSISATGTLEPEEVVDVGAQVAGRVRAFGRGESGEEAKRKVLAAIPLLAARARVQDGQKTSSQTDAGDSKSPSEEKKSEGPPIDYGSKVNKDVVLAYIDPETYQAQVAEAAAALARADADLLQSKAKRNQAKNDWERAQALAKIKITGTSGVASGRTIKAISDSDSDLAKANAETAEANVAVAEAAILQAKAALDRAIINLRYTVITSPVEGVIVARRVDVGQTVVAALNAPSLFLIAKDLKRMQVWASVNEADIGRIRQGMKVKFTVDAHPGETFEGEVLQTRLNAQMTQNVVTYTVVVKTENPEGKLLPYLTANLKFEVEHHRDVLKVPNAALRWKPRPQQIHPDHRPKKGSGRPGKGETKEAPAADSPGEKKTDARSTGQTKPTGEAKSTTDADHPKVGKDRGERGRLWVLEGDYVKPMDVTVSDTDGAFTEVSGPELKEGIEVVTGEEAPEQSDGDGTTNPFGPPKFGKGGKKG